MERGDEADDDPDNGPQEGGVEEVGNEQQPPFRARREFRPPRAWDDAGATVRWDGDAGAGSAGWEDRRAPSRGEEGVLDVGVSEGGERRVCAWDCAEQTCPLVGLVVVVILLTTLSTVRSHAVSVVDTVVVGGFVLALLRRVLRVDQPGPDRKGQARRDRGKDQKVRLGPLDRRGGGLVGHDQRAQNARLVQRGDEQQRVTRRVVEHQRHSRPVRHAGVKVRDDADQETHQVADNGPDENDQVPTRGAGVEFAADLHDEERRQKHPDADLGDGFGG